MLAAPSVRTALHPAAPQLTTRCSIASGGSPPHATSRSHHFAGVDAVRRNAAFTLNIALQLRSRRGDCRRCEDGDEDEELEDELHGVGLVRLW